MLIYKLLLKKSYLKKLNKLFLLDAMALIYRAHFAFSKNPIINSKGLNTSAIYGFTNTLLEVIKKEKPSHLGIAFDTKAPTFRVEMFKEYKANRQRQPEDIQVAIPYIKKILKAMHIPVIEKIGFEADDIIGTLAKQAEKEDFKVFMVTPDKDFAQLVSENIFMYRPARMGNGIEIWGVEEVQKKFEIIDPLQVIDFLGMMGDAVDNIPGLPGVGPRKINLFYLSKDSRNRIINHKDEIPGILGQKVNNNIDSAILSKSLATIKKDVPINISMKAMQ